MVIFALDASAVLRYLDREAGALRVAKILKEGRSALHEVIVSAAHWGEVAGAIRRKSDERTTRFLLSRLHSFRLEIVPATAERAVQAAMLKAEFRIPYVDAFGVQLAAELPGCTFVTADFDLKPAAKRYRIEFLPTK